MGYRRSRGLRSIATALLPSDRRLPHLFQRRQPFFFRERHWKGLLSSLLAEQRRADTKTVGSRDSASRTKHPYPAHRYQAGLARRPGYRQQAEGTKAGAYRLSAGRRSRQADWCRSVRSPAAALWYELLRDDTQLPRVLCSDAEEPQERLRRSHSSRSQPSTSADEEEEQLRHLLIRPIVTVSLSGALPPTRREGGLSFFDGSISLEHSFPLSLPPFASRLVGTWTRALQLDVHIERNEVDSHYPDRETEHARASTTHNLDDLSPLQAFFLLDTLRFEGVCVC